MAALCGNHSHFHKTVNLHEWWLFWAEDENHDKKLAIAGYTSRGQRPLRVFSSSPILRRHDVFTLETTDGIYVTILGLINKSRTEENGFPSEVFKCFFFGFPPHWEVCARHYLAQGFPENDISRVSVANSNLALDQDHIACMIREGSKDHNEAVRILTRAHAAKDTDQRKTLDVEKESIMKENTASKEASVSVANLNVVLDEEHIACMIREGLKDHNEAVGSAAKDTDQRKTPDVEKESIMTANTASKEASTTGKKTCTDASRRFTESSKMSDKAVKCRTRSGGARNTDRRRTATVKKENHLIEKAASKETSTGEKNTKRELTYLGSPVTPKADIKTSIMSPELSSVKRSRSGRILLPTLEYWRNQTAIYDAEHQVIGIKDSIPCTAEVRHEPKRSEGRARSKKHPNAATEKLTREPKRPVGRPQSKIDPNAATEKLTHEPKRPVGRLRKNLAAAKEFKSSRRR
ncbi:kinetochore-associated protein KNL-2 homolog isoform X2 [Daucus carota subsp. sativus]|uniref:kinetochore-associated protein KNL-2 homolog isoform X2 n=1 Tax=Daucus carota subsp. sativus TaxID=79200 RepID=UPI003082B17B